MPIQYDSNGIIVQNITEILDEREEALKLAMGEDFVIDKTTPIGNMELADANNELTIQELIGWLLPNQIDANTATGIFLDAICEKNRIYRKQPEYTKLIFKIIGTPNTQFNVGDITVSDSITDVYYNLDETCVIGEDGYTYAKFICDEYGENSPNTNSTLNILTPILGLDDVVIDFENIDITIGKSTETDEELRVRREYSVEQTSMNTSGSINANLYSLDGVKHVRYFENDTETTDENGLPMKSFEFVVDGGSENEIADIIYYNKPIGTRSYGETNVIKRDEYDNTYNISFTKVKEVNIGMNIILNTKGPQSQNWKNEVAQSIKDTFDKVQDIGTDVKAYNYYVAITKFNEVADIPKLMFINLDTEEKSEVSIIDIGNKYIARLKLDDIHISLGEL